MPAIAASADSHSSQSDVAAAASSLSGLIAPMIMDYSRDIMFLGRDNITMPWVYLHANGNEASWEGRYSCSGLNKLSIPWPQQKRKALQRGPAFVMERAAQTAARTKATPCWQPPMRSRGSHHCVHIIMTHSTTWYRKLLTLSACECSW